MTRRSANLLMSLSIGLVLTGCGDPIGTACEFRGSGFHASTNCTYRCLETRVIACPGGEQLRPPVCSGRTACQPGECPQGQICYHVQDPFEEESFCIEDTLCAGLSAAELQRWERETQVTAAALRAEYEARMQRRRAITSPALDRDAP